MCAPVCDVGKDVTVEQLEKDYDVRFSGPSAAGPVVDSPVAGWEGTPNCVSGVAFLKAFNEGRMKVTAEKVVCVGGGDTSIDVVGGASPRPYRANQSDRPSGTGCERRLRRSLTLP